MNYLMGTEVGAYNTTTLNELLLQWGETWCNKTSGTSQGIQGTATANLTTVLGGLSGDWPGIFGS